MGAGDSIDRVFEEPHGVAVASMIRLLYDERDDIEGLERALRIPSLNPGLRGHLQDRLAIAARGFA